MLLQEKTGTVDRQGEFKTKNFTICASRKAFEILSSGLYSDRVAAIVRELCTNAADSHTEAKQPKPFEVHLPGMLEPFFSVRDFGTGMTEEQVFQLYTSYFDSNRNRSNDFTGCLGLGSKSPFSYTDQFKVESRQNGVHKTYSCYIDETGTPAVTKLHEQKTDQRDGIEITIAIKQQDFHAFLSRAQTILSWFKPRPVITGVHGFTFFEPQYLHKTDLYGVARAGTGRSQVIMGNVAYPLNAHQIITTPNAPTGMLPNQGSASPTARMWALLNYGVDIYLPIGAVEIAASREGIGYTKAVVAYLRDVLTTILADLEKYCATLFTSAKTLWEARKLYVQHAGSFLRPLLPPTIEWNGIPVSGSVRMDRYKSAPELVEECFFNYGQQMKRRMVQEIQVNDWPIFIDDLNIGTYARVEAKITNAAPRRAYIISSKLRPVTDPNDSRPEFDKASGVYDVAVKSSTLDAPPRNGRDATGRTQYTVLLKFDPKVSVGNRHGWDPVKKDASMGGYYVTCLRFVARYYDPNRLDHAGNKVEISLPCHDMEKLIKCAKDLGHDVKEVFGCRPSDRETVEKHKDKWVDLFESIKALMKKDAEIVRLANLCDDLKDVKPYGSALSNFGNAGLKSHAVFGPLIKDMEDAEKSLKDSKVQSYLQIRRYLNLDADRKDFFNIRIMKALNTYPLLLCVSPMDMGKNSSSAVQYIKALDEHRKPSKHV